MRRLDVDEMLDEMTPQQFNEWIAYASIEPLEDGWQQTGVSCTVFYNSFMAAMSALGGRKVNKSDLAMPSDFIPGEHKRTSKPKPDGSIEAYRKQIENQARKWRS